jgi:hypothetical protein
LYVVSDTPPGGQTFVVEPSAGGPKLANAPVTTMKALAVTESLFRSLASSLGCHRLEPLRRVTRLTPMRVYAVSAFVRS